MNETTRPDGWKYVNELNIIQRYTTSFATLMHETITIIADMKNEEITIFTTFFQSKQQFYETVICRDMRSSKEIVILMNMMAMP